MLLLWHTVVVGGGSGGGGGRGSSGGGGGVVCSMEQYRNGQPARQSSTFTKLVPVNTVRTMHCELSPTFSFRNRIMNATQFNHHLFLMKPRPDYSCFQMYYQ